MRGSCLCGAVRFEVAGPFDGVVHCHCASCKKLAGGGSTTSGRIATDAIRILEGREVLRTFQPADGRSKTGLDGYFNERGIKTVYVVGLATDFCVAWTALDARKLGLEAAVIEDACRGIDTQGSLAAAWKSMESTGVKRLQSSDIAMPG